jgi:mRNA interferase YafQ
MLEAKFNNQFKKDYNLLEKRHWNMEKLLEIISFLIYEEPLPTRCRPHNLSGNYAGYTECHIEGDWVLIYSFGKDASIHFSRTGSHSDLF